MKRKIIIGVMVGLLVGAGTTFAASANYYAELLAGQQEQMQSEVDSKYEEYAEYRSEQVSNDMTSYVAQKRTDIMSEMDAVIEAEVNEAAEQRQANHAEAVDAEAKRIKSELTEYVRNKVAEEYGGETNE